MGMRAMQTTGSIISISIVARDDDGTLQRLFDVLTILAAQLLTWINIQIAAEHQRIQFELLAERAIVLMTLLIEIVSRVLSFIAWIEQAPDDFLDWCEAFYVESCRLWQDVFARPMVYSR
jgi:uncharacterized membrane protein